MFGEEKNLKLKDTNLPLPNLPLHRGRSEEGVMSYTKTNKLITALYMVTDIIDKDEPLRNKLRTLGIEIISDPERIRPEVGSYGAGMSMRIDQIVSFLGIASAINIISEMNCNILRKEFLELDRSIKESIGNTGMINRQIDLTEFFENSKEEKLPLPNLPLYRGRSKEGVLSFRGEPTSKGHTRIGVQKGSTLLQALSKVEGKAIKDMSNKNNLAPYEAAGFRSGFNILKKQRRDDIIFFIRKNGDSSTITDIKNGAYGSLVSCGEKTLQRELISMVKDGVLKKTGEKRWSRYFLASSTS